MNKEQAQFRAEYYQRIANGEREKDLIKEIQAYVTNPGGWFNLGENMLVVPRSIYRWKPRTVTIEIPEPMQEHPEKGQTYWYRDADTKDGWNCIQWYSGDEEDLYRFERGIWDSEEKMKQVLEADKKVVKENMI